MNPSQRKLEFTGLLTQVHARLFSYVHSLVNNLTDADDIVQRTSLVLWEKFDSYDRSQSFFAWAAGVARLEVLNFVRKRGREKLYFSQDVAELLAATHEVKSADLEAQAAALNQCLQKLPAAERELVESCYAAGMPVEQIAQSLHRSTHSVYNSLRRVRRWLLDCVRRTSLAEGV